MKNKAFKLSYELDELRVSAQVREVINRTIIEQRSAEHLEALRAGAQIAERHESEMRTKLAESAEQYTRGYLTQIELAEVAECYSMSKRACFIAQERYREATRTN